MDRCYAQEQVNTQLSGNRVGFVGFSLISRRIDLHLRRISGQQHWHQDQFLSHATLLRWIWSWNGPGWQEMVA
eukprot:5836801-Karenia_brevis.AAC.1